MAESQILSVIRMWAAVAWADGVLAVPEAEGLRKLVASADLTDGERAAATQFTSARVALPDTHLTTMPAETRKSIYRARAAWRSSITCSRRRSARCSIGSRRCSACRPTPPPRSKQTFPG